MQTLDELLFPGVRIDKWQMMSWERIALTGVLARMRPKLSLEVGVYYGGSLTLTSQFAEEIVAIDIDSDTRNRFQVPSNAEVVVGDSRHEIPRLLRRFKEEGKALEFVLIDADHSAAGVRRDIELILQYTPLKPMIILAHDSGNPECRSGMRQVDWQANPYVHQVDLDFVPGKIIEHSVAEGKGEVWGGFAIAYLYPQARRGPLAIQEGARSSLRSIHYCSLDLGVIPASF
jgi:hypothetical protein